MRETTAWGIVSLFGLGALGLPSAAQKTARPSVLAAARRSVEAGAFERAQQQLAGVPAGELERDAEALILRGMARWGAALDRFTALGLQVGPRELISQVRQLTLEAVRQHAPETPEGERLARVLPEVEAEVTRRSGAAGDPDRAAGEIGALLESAEADFARAMALPAPRGKPWCEAPGRWLLLARAHRLSVECERGTWGRDLSAAGLAGPVSPERRRQEAKRQELEQSFLQELDRQLAAIEDRPEAVRELHAAADALLVFGLSTKQITRWPTGPGPHPDPAALNEAARPAAQAAIREVRSLIRRDPTQAVIQLYRRCTEAPASSGPAYTRYLIDFQGGAATPARLAAFADALSPKEAAGNPLIALERSRLLSRQAGQEEALRQAVANLGSGRLERPVWTAAPPPIRAAFLALPQWLRQGDSISVSFRSLLHPLEKTLSRADPPEVHTQYQQLRLKLGLTLATSDLPWDRETGYEMAGSALGRLERAAEGMPPDPGGALVALRARLQAGASRERFPARMCVVLSDGRLAWLTDPTADLTLSNPLVLVHRNGLFLKAVPRR